MSSVITRGKIIRADLANFDGRNTTYSRVDATGGTVTGLVIGNEVDVLQVYGSGTSRTDGTIAAAVTAIGSSACTLVFAPGTWTIDESVTIPSNLSCLIPAGVIFDVAAGKTLTFSGLTIVERPASWTSGSGTVTATNTIPQVRTAAEISGSATPVQHAYHEADPRRYSTSFAATFVTDRNTPWGYKAFQSATPGVLNVAVGFEALKSATTGGGGTTNAQGNTVVGAQAMSGATETGDYNCAYGYLSLYSATSAYCNVAMGIRTLEDCSTGQYNTAVGCDALSSCTGSSNTAVGAKALLACTSGTPNTAVGTSALLDLTTGANNVAVGAQAGENITIGTQNVAIGDLALDTMTDNSFCTAVGYWALRLNTAATNTAIGHKSMQNNSTGTGNTAVGNQSLGANTEGDNNTAVGYGALLLNETGDQSTAVGQDALRASTGGRNTGVGYFAGRATSSGTANVFIGGQAGSANTTGAQNTVVGDSALDTASTASANTAIGYDAGGALTGGSNTCVGFQSLNTETSGTNNTAVGYQAGASQSGGLSNTTTLGNGANSTASNQVTLGNASVATLRCQQTTITALSDLRFKKNIKSLDLPDEFLDEVEIVAYEWIFDDMPQGPQVGVIAQQLDALQDKYGLQWLGLVDKTNPDKWEATPGKLLFPLIVRSQRQAKLLNDLAKRVEALESR